MKPFTTVGGVAAPLPASNINTDVIMPKQFLKGIDRSGLDRGVFHDLRFDATGAERPDFVLNRAPWRQASFLVVGPNFGCGSSREHAVWGLNQLGIRALIGTSFAGIFFDNCARNGLLAVTVGDDDIDPLMERASDPTRTSFEVDLLNQRIATSDGFTVRFGIEPTRKEALLEGLDAVGATLRYRDEITAFERSYLETNPWSA
jgi:3-isopropylmalate/(R)-2-methylmalate dehydratase small subunit